VPIADQPPHFLERRKCIRHFHFSVLASDREGHARNRLLIRWAVSISIGTLFAKVNGMSRNLTCPNTEEPCGRPDCKIGLCQEEVAAVTRLTELRAQRDGGQGADVGNETVRIEVAGSIVKVGKRFYAGSALTEAQAKVLNGAYLRQFRNNQNANALARAKRGDPPLTAKELLAIWMDYEPDIGGTGHR
jgi:hypothetical protein